MSRTNIISFLVFSLLCFVGSMNAAWAQSKYNVDDIVNEAQGENVGTIVKPKVSAQPKAAVIAEVAEVADALLMEPSWKRGFDLRLNLGFTNLFYQDFPTTQYYEDDDLLGGFVNVEIGGRSPYIGGYFVIGVDFFAGSVVATSVLGLMRFFIPATKTLEISLATGTGIAASRWAFPVYAGMNWHLDDLTLGFELQYQANVSFGGCHIHLLRPTFTIGYTF